MNCCFGDRGSTLQNGEWCSWVLQCHVIQLLIISAFEKPFGIFDGASGGAQVGAEQREAQLCWHLADIVLGFTAFNANLQ